MTRIRHLRGFTLIEILVVVTILGTLGAIVLPQFANTTSDVRRASLAQQLQTIRKQIQLYSLEHRGEFPPITGDDWTALTTPGSGVSAYMHVAPRNNLNDRSTILVVANDVAFGDAVAGAGIGFVYNPASGMIWATNTAGNRIYNEDNPLDPNN